MQITSFRIWTRVAVFISNDDNHYTPSISICEMRLCIDGLSSSNVEFADLQADYGFC